MDKTEKDKIEKDKTKEDLTKKVNTNKEVKSENENPRPITYTDLNGHMTVGEVKVTYSKGSMTDGNKGNNKTVVENKSKLVNYSETRKGQVEIHDGYLNLRKEATTESHSIAHLQNGTSVSVKGYKGNWVLVSVEGKEGYVFNRYMHVEVPTGHKAEKQISKTEVKKTEIKKTDVKPVVKNKTEIKKTDVKPVKEDKTKPVPKPVINNVPVIKGHNIVIEEGHKFEISALGLSASDVEDGNLTNSIKVISSNVDTNKPGVYDVTVQVADSKGAQCTQTYKVTVNKKTVKPTPAPVPVEKNTAPVINAKDVVSLPMGTVWTLAHSNVTATDKEDGTVPVTITKNTISPKFAGTYQVTLEAKDSKGLTTTKTITVKIMAKAPVLNAHDVIIIEGTNFTTGLVGLDAKDCNGKDITSNVKSSGNINTAVAGKYPITYTVVDSFGLSATKTINVTVTAKAKPVAGWSANSQEFHNAVTAKMNELVNAHRRANGIAEFQISQLCEDAANWKSKDMETRGYFDHKTPEGKQTGQVKPEWKDVAGENIAQRNIDKVTGLNQANAEDLAVELFNQWKASHGHNAAMLNDWFMGYGFGFSVSSTGVVNASQNFK